MEIAASIPRNTAPVIVMQCWWHHANPGLHRSINIRCVCGVVSCSNAFPDKGEWMNESSDDTQLLVVS